MFLRFSHFRRLRKPLLGSVSYAKSFGGVTSDRRVNVYGACKRTKTCIVIEKPFRSKNQTCVGRVRGNVSFPHAAVTRAHGTWRVFSAFPGATFARSPFRFVGELRREMSHRHRRKFTNGRHLDGVGYAWVVRCLITCPHYNVCTCVRVMGRGKRIAKIYVVFRPK